MAEREDVTEPERLACYAFVEDGPKTLVLEAYEKKLIMLDRASEILRIPPA